MNNAKQFALLAIGSILILLLSPYLYSCMSEIVDAHNWVADQLGVVFSSGSTGSWIKNLIAFLAVPLIIGLVPFAIYFSIQRKPMPYVMHVIWVAWVIQATAVVSMSAGVA